MLHKTQVSRTKLRTAKITAGLVAIILCTGVVYLQSCKQQPVTTITQRVIRSGQLTDGSGQVADTMPKAMYDIGKFLSENLKYPEPMRQKELSGTVVIKFLVDEAGNITNPEIIKSPDTVFSAEALRVVRLLPPWKPGIKGGKAIKVIFYLPVMFALGDGVAKENGLTAEENDTLNNLIYKAQKNNNGLTNVEGNRLARLMQKRTTSALYLNKDSLKQSGNDNGLTPQENDTLARLLDKHKDDKYVQTKEDKEIMIRLMHKMKRF